MIDANFESILVPEDNGKQNPDEFYSNKHQKYIACSYSNQLACVDNKFKSDEDAVYSSSNSILEESKYYSDVIKKHLIRNLW